MRLLVDSVRLLNFIFTFTIRSTQPHTYKPTGFYLFIYLLLLLFYVFSLKGNKLLIQLVTRFFFYISIQPNRIFIFIFYFFFLSIISLFTNTHQNTLLLELFWLFETLILLLPPPHIKYSIWHFKVFISQLLPKIFLFVLYKIYVWIEF